MTTEITEINTQAPTNLAISPWPPELTQEITPENVFVTISAWLQAFAAVPETFELFRFSTPYFATFC